LTNDWLVDIEGEIEVNVWKWNARSSVPTHIIRHPTSTLAGSSNCCLKVEKNTFLTFGKREQIFLTCNFLPSKPNTDHTASNTFFFSPLKRGTVFSAENLGVPLFCTENAPRAFGDPLLGPTRLIRTVHCS